MFQDLWGPIDAKEWSTVPHTSGRLASEADVKEGRAVFYLKGGGPTPPAPHVLRLPQCALWNNPEGGTVPGVIVQAERGDGQVLVGFRPMAGGNVVATLQEFELVATPEKFPA